MRLRFWNCQITTKCTYGGCGERRQNNRLLSKDCDASVKLRHLKIFILSYLKRLLGVHIHRSIKLIADSYILVRLSQSFGLNRTLTYPTKESGDSRITVMKGLFYTGYHEDVHEQEELQ